MMKEGALPELPGGWVWARLGDIAEKINPGFPSGKHNMESQGVPHLRPMNINVKGEINFSEVKYVQPNSYDSLLKGDVLFNNTNSPELLGKTSYIKDDTNWAYSNHMTRIRLNSSFLNSAWISYYLHSLFLKGFFKISCTHHVNQASINSTFLSQKVPIPIPPLPEQRGMISKIEQLFSELDNGINNFKKAQVQLKLYRQSVLKAACEGKLVPTEAELARAEGREYEAANVLLGRILKERREKWNGKGKYKEPAAVDTNELSELPEGWRWATSGALSWFVTSGSRDWRKYYSSSGALFIRTQDINQNKLSFDNVAFVALPEKAEGKRSLVKKNDILIIITGANVGKVALVDKEIGEAYVSQSVALMKLVMPDIARYIHFAMIADGFGKTELDNMVYGVGRPVLSLENVQDIILPLPPFAEQRRIVAEVERRLSVCDKMEATITESLQKAESLRQSILKKAFEGKLLNKKELEKARNAPDWEPAEKLLERIRKEKARTGENKRKR